MIEVAIAGVILYLVVKLNSVLNVGIKIVNTAAKAADDGVETMGNNAHIQFQETRIEQYETLSSMTLRPSNKDISDMLKPDNQAAPKI